MITKNEEARIKFPYTSTTSEALFRAKRRKDCALKFLLKWIHWLRSTFPPRYEDTWGRRSFNVAFSRKLICACGEFYSIFKIDRHIKDLIKMFTVVGRFKSS